MRNTRDEGLIFLWQSFLKGDDKSFSAIYHCYADQLLSYGYKFSTDREIVHDSIQEIFIDLYEKRENTSVNIKNLKAYLFVALRNAIIKKVKKSRKYETLELTDKQDIIPFYVEYSFQEKLIEEEISSEINDTLKSAIKELPARQKEIIYLKFEEELNYEQIAEILNISVESCRKLLYRSLSSLRERIHPKPLIALFLFFCKKYHF